MVHTKCNLFDDVAQIQQKDADRSDYLEFKYRKQYLEQLIAKTNAREKNAKNSLLKTRHAGFAIAKRPAKKEEIGPYKPLDDGQGNVPRWEQALAQDGIF